MAGQSRPIFSRTIAANGGQMYVQANLDATADRYFGHDVQRYWITRAYHKRGLQIYRLWQMPHYMPVRNVATVTARTAPEAMRLFNKMAAERAE
jgi:hypothetical protein